MASPSSNPSSSSRRLLTRDQVLAALRAERDRDGLSATARRYGVSPQQLWNVLAEPPLGKLSKRLLGKLRYRLHEFLERVEDPQQ